jgi:hypothetical protein
VEDGEFTVNSFYGSINRQKFSLVAILVVHGDDPDPTPSDTSDEEEEENEEEQEEIESEELDEVQPNESTQESQPINQPSLTDEEEEKHIDSDGVMSTDVSYAGVVYYEIKGSEDLVTFATAKNLNALLQYINDCHPNAEKDINITYRFKPGCKYIELIIDAPQEYTTDGWIIRTRHKPCRMYQKHIDLFGSQDYPLPSKCLISVYSINRPDTVPVLHYGIPLEGVDHPVTIFIHRALRTTNTGTPLEATPSSSSGAQPTPSTNKGTLMTCNN